MSTKYVAFMVLSLLVVFTLILGFWGWHLYGLADGAPVAWLDSLYRTLLAFTGDAMYVEPPGTIPLNGWLLLARFTGLFATIAAAISLGIVFLGEQVKRVLAIFIHDAQVVIGASDFAVEYAARLGPTLVFDTAEQLERVVRPKARHWVLNISDTLEQKLSSRSITGVPAFGAGSRRIIFGDPDAITNVERARRWMDEVPAKRRRDTELVLLIDDNSVARDIGLLDPAFEHVKLISRSDAIARALVTAIAPTEMARLRGHRSVHVAVFEMSNVSLAVAEELVMRCHHPEIDALHLTFVSADIEAAKSRMRAERPDLLDPGFTKEGVFLHWVEMDPMQVCSAFGCGGLARKEEDIPLTAMVVAMEDDRQSVGVAMRLRQIQLEHQRLRAPIFMLASAFSSLAPRTLADLTGGIATFGGNTLDREDLELESAYQGLARSTHEVWRNSPDVKPTPENAWNALTTVAQRSSYRAALSVLEVYGAVGLVPPAPGMIAGLRLHSGAANTLLSDGALMQSVARIEHLRWNAERRAEGFRPAEGMTRDNEKKRHALLVPFEDLPVVQRQKDERNVREILNLGLKRHEAQPHQPCWRFALRVGVVGPLQVDDAALQELEAAFDACFGTPPLAEFEHRTLEILTPNAPGFDRRAVPLLLNVWKRRTGREGIVTTFDAARLSAVNEIATDHLMELSGGPREKVVAACEAETASLHVAVAEKLLRSVDMRPLGKSDAELLQDRDLYFEIVREVQDLIMSRADIMVFHTNGRQARWSMMALERWREAGKPFIEIGQK